MALYGYRCTTHGDFEAHRPMGSAAPHELCPRCEEPGARVFFSPMLNYGPRAVVSAMDRAERSADLPQVVDALPGRARTAGRVSTNPAHRALPRP